MNFALYGRRLLGYTSFCVALIALLNAIIDPYLYLDFLSIDGLNAERSSLVNKRSRVAKAAVLKHCPKQVLIFGSSRAQVGLREDFSGYGGRRVYNAALEGSNMLEVRHAMILAANYQQAETIIIGLDFEAFTDSRSTSADFMDSDFSSAVGGRSAESYLRYLLSPQSLMASWETIKSNNTSGASLCSSGGHLDLSEQEIDHRRAFSNVLTNMLVTPGAYAAFRYSTERLSMFKEAISTLHNGETDVLLFFSPIHARQTEVIRGLGLYDQYEKWKSDISSSVENIRANSDGKGRLELWDFSGYNSITTEKVPQLGSKEKMQWYRESSHYSRATGDIIVNRLFNLPQDNAQFPNFGRIVTSDVLAQYFMVDREAAKRYAKLNSNEINDVLKSIEKTKAERQRVEASLGY